MKWKLGRRAARAGMVGAMVVSGLMFASAPSALANGDWDTQIGPSGSGCYAYTTYTSNIVTPHIWQQPGNVYDRCTLVTVHVGYDSNHNVQYSNRVEVVTSESSTAADGPSWYYGPWNGSGWMCVQIYASDSLGNRGTHGNYVEVC